MFFNDHDFSMTCCQDYSFTYTIEWMLSQARMKFVFQNHWKFRVCYIFVTFVVKKYQYPWARVLWWENKDISQNS